jgi:WD40 repeat protein
MSDELKHPSSEYGKMAVIGLRFTIHKSEKLLISILFIPLFMHRELILLLLTFYIHSFTFSSVVCCVSFSADGRYLATRCNRTTQIFDVQTGGKIWCAVIILFHLKNISNFFCSVISDESKPKSTDLYIRSVRFSPDGKLIATGAEGHKIRVCPFFFFFDGRCLYLLTD